MHAERKDPVRTQVRKWPPESPAEKSQKKPNPVTIRMWVVMLEDFINSHFLRENIKFISEIVDLFNLNRFLLVTNPIFLWKKTCFLWSHEIFKAIMKHVLLSCKPVKILFFSVVDSGKTFITQHEMCYFDTSTPYQNVSLHIQRCGKEYFSMNFIGNFHGI